MIILRQKQYTWSEFGKAVKSIGIGAATGATIGFGPFKRQSKIGAAVGGAIGAGLGAGMYHELHKNRLKAKKKIEDLKKDLGEDILGYLKGNLPKNYPDIVKLVGDLNKLKKDLTHRGTTGELSECYIWLKSINFDNDSDLSDYLQSCELGKDEIPIIEIGITSFGDCIDSSYVVYNIKSKKFYSRAYKVNDLIPGLKNFLFGPLEYIKETIEESIETEKECDFYDSDYLDEDYKTWISEYYEKAKNLIKQSRL